VGAQENSEKQERINILFDNELSAALRFLRDWHKIGNNADMVRFLIMQEFRRVVVQRVEFSKQKQTVNAP
jgi:hypothetical protein